MSYPEKRHVSHKAGMQHLSYLDSFMDETDREVMSLTDRAFKSLCIGDEAIYNDSGLSPSPVDWHKPLAEDKREKSFWDVKNHGVHRANGLSNKPWQMIENSSKLSSLFGDAKVTNGDSWDKSALLSIQKELSEFSYQNHFAEEQFHHARNHLKLSENGSAKDTSMQSGKSSKNKQIKSSKLRKLNSKNSFLHSEFSAFRSWGDLNRFRLDSISQTIFQKCPTTELYDSQLYKELATSNRLPAPAPWSSRDTDLKNATPEPQHEPKPVVSQQAGQTLNVEQIEAHRTPQLQQPQLQTSSGLVQRCQSDGDLSAPWRKKRSRPKGVPTLKSSSVSERSKPADEGAMSIRQEVRTMEEPASSSSTPFSILHLLTPVIPSRQGTESSEVLQSVLSPMAAELPRLLGTEVRPSPEVKRESYKAMASGLLFNLKDNRKRVKAMYSPPKFKQSNSSAGQNETSSLVEQDATVDKLPLPEVSDAKPSSPLGQHEHLSPLRPETADMQKSPCTPCNTHLNSGLPDDFLALSLLQDGGLKSKRSPVVKSSYPSLNLYCKAALAESDAKATPVDVPAGNKEHSRVPERNGKDLIEPVTNQKIKQVNYENTRQPEKPAEALLASSNQDKMNTGGTGKVEQKPAQDKDSCRKDTKTKHSFSARQNNYIKSQRYVSVDEEEAHQTRERISLGKKESASKVEESIDVQNDKEILDNPNDQNRIHLKNDFNTSSEDRTSKKNALSMKGNTSAKIALFDFKDKEPSKTHQVPESKRENVVMDKYKQAAVALEEMIASREHRKHHSISSTDTDERQPGGQELGDCKQASQTDTSESVTTDRRGQKATSQNVQSMPGTNTKHGERHVAEVKLAQACEPCEQEGAAERSRHKTGLIKPREVDATDRPSQRAEADEVRSMDKLAEVKERRHVDMNSSVVSRSPDDLTKQGGESGIQEGSSYKAEVPSREGGEQAGHEMEGNGFVGERTKVKDVKLNIQKERGPVKGHVSMLLESLTEPRENAPESLIQEGIQGLEIYAERDNINQEVVAPNYTFGAADVDATLIKHGHKALGTTDLTLAARRGEDLHNKSLNANVSDVPEDLHSSGRHSSVSIEFFNDLVDKSDKEKVKSNQSNQIPQILESGKHDEAQNVSENMYDIPSQCSDILKESNQTEESSHKTHDSCEGNLEQTKHSLSKSKPNSSGMAASPTSEAEKSGWVRCLIDSGKNLTPTCPSNASSPTMGKPALFRVKDNTFSASPVTKTVRPTLHKTVSGMTQPWSPRDSLSGSERGEEDPDLFKDCLEVQSPIPQLNRLPTQVKLQPASQFTPVQKRTLVLLDGYTVPEEEEWRSAIGSVPEGIESLRTSAGDTTEELAFSKEAPKAPSERSESVCSGHENQSQNKPPTVPPKSEKALRRAMKLTSRRIQKAAETKNRSERGRSSEKGASQKRERRHHSSDKVLSKQSYQREQGADGGGNQRTGEDSSQTPLPKSQAGARRSSNPDSQGKESRKPKPGGHQRDVKDFTERKCEDKGQFDVPDVDVCGERPGRTADKVYRRAQSLDRFSCSKNEQRLSSTVDSTNTEASTNFSTPQRAPIHLSRQNSMELIYAPPANNIVTQSFPITQRRLLQDPDSGQYFVVDMPVKVKTKTFFDPETGSYVQLPVQSLEAQSQAMEVLKAPAVMLYHGYVPLPVSAVAQQNSTANAVNSDYLDVFESSELDRQRHVECMNTMNEHLPQEDLDLDPGIRN
ncbi:cardiac-enriched FHL2-interacting protein [Trichomycterus rosablanca]|uniref:cardiac-enriched FHL2-interacting protein n=1 Tax=Trichomycterus rosablanca TaxID=2290929 RepID=UPI002F350ADB